MDNLPMVSVIIPVYNGEKVICQCLEKILQQSYPEEKKEIIVIDNNSTDNTYEMVKKFDVIIVKETQKGPAAARNKGIRLSRGEILIFIDADCLADEDIIMQHVQTHLRFRKFRKNIKIVGGGIKGYNKNFWAVCDDLTSWFKYHPLLPPKKTKSHCTANLSVSREIFFTENLFFDEELITCEDYAFCITAQRKGFSIYFEPKAVVTHINRTSFKEFFNHCKNWTISEFELRKKGIRKHIPKPFILWFIIYGMIYLYMIWEVLHNCIRCRRYKVFIYLPLIALAKFNWCFNIFRAEMKFRRYINSKKPPGKSSLIDGKQQVQMIKPTIG